MNTTDITKEKFEYIIEQLNIIKPTFSSWGCGDEFGGYGEKRKMDCLEGTITPLVYDHNVFGFSYSGVIYYRTNNLNALRLAKTYASSSYCELQEI